MFPGQVGKVAAVAHEPSPQVEQPKTGLAATLHGAGLSPGSGVGQAYVVARANFNKLMARVNQQMSTGMEKGATSSIITLG